LAGVVQFSDVPQTRYETDNLPFYVPRLTGDLDAIIQAITAMTQIKSYTAIGTGLNFGQYALITAGRWGLSPPVPKVILLITDGSNNRGPDPTPVSQAIRDNGTEIFVIGVGGDFDLQQLLTIASNPKEGVHFFNITDYGALLAITNEVAYQLCYSRGGSAPASLYLLFLLLLPLAAGLGMFVFIWRRRKPKPKAVPPPEPVPEPVPVKAAAPSPIADKPKDWTVPGTRYIGFGQANIKVKWGTDAPPSAPRGHDKYDRWSMQHGGGPLPPAAASPTSQSPMLAPNVESAPSGEGAAASGDCCTRFCPCCLPLFGGGMAQNRSKMQKSNAPDDGVNWQENTAATSAETPRS